MAISIIAREPPTSIAHGASRLTDVIVGVGVVRTRAARYYRLGVFVGAEEIGLASVAGFCRKNLAVASGADVAGGVIVTDSVRVASRARGARSLVGNFVVEGVASAGNANGNVRISFGFERVNGSFVISRTTGGVMEEVVDVGFESENALIQDHRVAGDDGFEGVAAASADDVAAVLLDKARSAIRAFELESGHCVLRGAREKSDGNDAGFHGCLVCESKESGRCYRKLQFAADMVVSHMDRTFPRRHNHT
jgi:hypothetical protein